jgi:hypothetical protein
VGGVGQKHDTVEDGGPGASGSNLGVGVDGGGGRGDASERKRKKSTSGAAAPAPAKPTTIAPPPESLTKTYLDKQDKDGLTALDIATVNGYVEVVKLLLKRGASPVLQGKDKLHALDRALMSGNQAVGLAILRALKQTEEGRESIG